MMNLQVGDKVRYKGNVVTISATELDYETNTLYAKDGSQMVDMVPVSEFEPIDITPAILLASGFYQRDIYYTVQNLDGKGHAIDYRVDLVFSWSRN